MLGMKLRKKAVLVFAIVAMIAVVAASSVAYPAFVAPSEVQSKQIMVKAKGWAFQRVDSKTIKQSNVTLELTLEVGEREGTAVVVVNASGSVDVNGTVYIIEIGKGLIETKRHVVLVRCEGVDGDGNEATLGIGGVYFWWGGHLCAFRAKAFLRTTENPMLLLLRGAAKVQ
jgi:hypothetical protein